MPLTTWFQTNDRDIQFISVLRTKLRHCFFLLEYCHESSKLTEEPTFCPLKDKHSLVNNITYRTAAQVVVANFSHLPWGEYTAFLD